MGHVVSEKFASAFEEVSCCLAQLSCTCVYSWGCSWGLARAQV
jgi:hypothetical protein